MPGHRASACLASDWQICITTAFNVAPINALAVEGQLEIQSVDIDNWKNVRGPRPWEEGNEYNKILKERQMMKQQSGES
ncbi:hypothetical protein HPB49_017576 [Dermacentor silvarum]|uniref:Uncharacterized protein n=1 Tax=Dermacentor silvarum TaxID=543639 RepID=A0ACB8CGJ3_DERSI|nr:hypothetical protein HPB49_017576 [Dermacentor silvarum]